MKKTMCILVVLSLLIVMAVGCSTTTGDAGAAPAEDAAQAATVEPEDSAAEGSGDTQPANAGGDEEFFVGLAWNALDAMPKELMDECVAGAEARGWKVAQTNADFDAIKLISDVESLIEQGVDIVVVRGVNAPGNLSIVDLCNDADVPVMFIEVQLEDGYEDKVVTYAENAAINVADALSEYLNGVLDADPDMEMNIGYLVGDYANPTGQDRWQTIPEKVPRSNHLVDTQADWLTTTAMSVTEDWLQKYPEMNVIVACNNEMAVGAIQALQAAGKTKDDYLVLSVDTMDIIMDYLKEGWCDATVGHDIPRSAEAILGVLDKFAAGDTESIEKYTPFNSYFLATTENIQDIEDGKVEPDYL